MAVSYNKLWKLLIDKKMSNVFIFCEEAFREGQELE